VVDVEAVGHGGVHRWPRCRASGRQHLVVDRGRPPAPPPQLVEAGIRGDAVEPGAEAGPAVVPVEAPDDGDQRLLAGVGGVGVVSGEPPAQGVDPVVVPSQQRVERLVVPVQGSGDERLVIERGNDLATLGEHRGRLGA
jgi:hypothetical protein